MQNILLTPRNRRNIAAVEIIAQKVGMKSPNAMTKSRLWTQNYNIQNERRRKRNTMPDFSEKKQKDLNRKEYVLSFAFERVVKTQRKASYVLKGSQS